MFHRISSVFFPGLMAIICLVMGLRGCVNSYKKPYPAFEATVIKPGFYLKTYPNLQVRQGFHRLEKNGVREVYDFSDFFSALEPQEQARIIARRDFLRDSVEASFQRFDSRQSQAYQEALAASEAYLEFKEDLKIDDSLFLEFRIPYFVQKQFGLLLQHGDTTWHALSSDSSLLGEVQPGKRIKVFYQERKEVAPQLYWAAIEAVNPWFRPWRRDSEAQSGIWFYAIFGVLSGFVVLFNLSRGGQRR